MDGDDSMIADKLGETSSKLVDRLSKYEELGQSVVMGKQALIELDKRRQKCREAVRVLRKYVKKEDEKRWVCLSSETFIELPAQKSISLLEEDMKTIDLTIESTRNELKKRIDELKEMENSKDLETLGFKLKPVY